MMMISAYGNPYSGYCTLAHTESGFEAYLVMEVLFLNKLLKGLNHIIGTFDMTGTAYANGQFKHD
jgi:hypothetical protein